VQHVLLPLAAMLHVCLAQGGHLPAVSIISCASLPCCVHAAAIANALSILLCCCCHLPPCVGVHWHPLQTVALAWAV
jgi:hypothetical protein